MRFNKKKTNLAIMAAMAAFTLGITNNPSVKADESEPTTVETVNTNEENEETVDATAVDEVEETDKVDAPAEEDAEENQAENEEVVVSVENDVTTEVQAPSAQESVKTVETSTANTKSVETKQTETKAVETKKVATKKVETANSEIADAKVLTEEKKAPVIYPGYTGVRKYNGNWYYFVDGSIDTSCNSVKKNEYGWWRVVNGKVDFNYTGVGTNEFGTWYCQNGKVDFSLYGVVKDYTNGNWYYVQGGKVTPGPTVQKNSYGWWFIDKEGKVDFKANTVAKNQYGWWATQNGKVTFNFTGMAKNDLGTWYCSGSKVDFSVNSVVKDQSNGKWYNVKGGKLQTGVTVAKNSNGWWYIDKNGQVDFKYNGLATNENGTWNLINGKVNFGFYGVTKHNSESWYCTGGKVDTTVSGVVKDNNNGNWYYVQKGKVIPGPTVQKNSNGWWYIDKNGKVDFNFTGFASNENGTWAIQNGKVNLSLNGDITLGGETKYVVNGKVSQKPTSNNKPATEERKTELGTVNKCSTPVTNINLQMSSLRASSDTDINYVIARLKEEGFNNAAISGLLGCWTAESGVRSTNLEDAMSIGLEAAGYEYYTGRLMTPKIDDGTISRDEFADEGGLLAQKYGEICYNLDKMPYIISGYGYGLAQWTSANRKAQLYDAAKQYGMSVGDLTLQTEFAIYEIKNNYGSAYTGNGKSLYTNLINLGNEDVDLATAYVLCDYEMPGWPLNGTRLISQDKPDEYDDMYVDRVGFASNIYKSLTGVEVVKVSDGVWAYTKNEKIDTTYTGLASNTNGVWYIKNGYVDFNFYGTYAGRTIKAGKAQEIYYK